jgi:hypothetical protein
VTGPGGPPANADELLVEAEQYLARARTDTSYGVEFALIGIGKATVAQVRQQGEFYREVLDLLTTARGDAPGA